MTVHPIDVEAIKQRVSIIDLFESDGNKLVKKGNRLTCLCPFHHEKSRSCTLYPQTNSFNCFGCSTAGSVIDYVMKRDGCDFKAAITTLANFANIPMIPKPKLDSNLTPLPPQPFDWFEKVRAVTPDKLNELAQWRGYSLDFCSWLNDQNLIGLFKGGFALPVHENIKAVGCHYQNGAGWSYFPTGSKCTPLTVGNTSQADQVFAFESQWDAFALMDKLRWHATGGEPSTAIVITRGSSNGHRVAGICAARATLYTFPQNDQPKGEQATPAERWMRAVASHAGCAVVNVATPKQHKDLNDWTRAGASEQDIRLAIQYAVPRQTSETELAEDRGALITRLAQMHPMEYDQVREDEANKAGVRVGTLDEVANKRRAELNSAKQTTTIVEADPEPWPEPVNGVELLGAIEAAFRRFTVLPDHGYAVMSLWTLHSYVFESSEYSPIIALVSPEKRCGKSVTLRVAEAIVHSPRSAANISAPVMFRAVEALKPTLLIDEYDSQSDGERGEALRNILNSGHHKNGSVLRCEGDSHEIRAFSTYCPKLIAGIGNLPDTVMDRSIVLMMRRKLRHESVERLRRFNGIEIRRKCLRWTADNQEALENITPSIPAELNDRAADNWEPLLSLADLIGGGWVERATAASLGLSQDTATDNLATLLLSDMRDLFADRRVDRLRTSELLESLNKMEERPWPTLRRGHPINAHRLGRMLSPFKVESKTIKFKSDAVGTGAAKGYYLDDLRDAFGRYLPVDIPGESTSQSVTALPSPSLLAKTAIPEGLPEHGGYPSGNGVSSNKISAGNGVTHLDGEVSDKATELAHESDDEVCFERLDR